MFFGGDFLKELMFTFYHLSDGDVFSTIENHLQNPIIKSFLEIQENSELLKKAIHNPTKLAKQQLDDNFREYFFKIRFTSYLSNAIHFNAINYDKKIKLFLERNQPILDSPVKGREGEALLDIITPKDLHERQASCIDSSNIEDHLTNYSLFKGIQQLTDNQRQLLSLAYIFGLNDSEIASHLNISQQAVSKSHRKALRKLREIIENREKEGV